MYTHTHTHCRRRLQHLYHDGPDQPLELHRRHPRPLEVHHTHNNTNDNDGNNNNIKSINRQTDKNKHLKRTAIEQ